LFSLRAGVNVRVAVLRIALITAMLFSIGCTAYMRSPQSGFFSEFSLRRLVEKNGSRPGLDCSTGVAGGGGGGGSRSGREFRVHKAESLSCRLSGGAGEFDEASFNAALKEGVEGDIRESGAKVTGSGGPDAGRFYFEYEVEAGRGRVEITGRTVGDSYSLKADLDERDKGEAK
jgi:hypothetical protein